MDKIAVVGRLLVRLGFVECVGFVVCLVYSCWGTALGIVLL